MSSLPKTCRAAALVDAGSPLEILEVKVPDQLEGGALLVKTEAATVCATDVHLWQHTVGAFAASNYPVILGHEMTGRIVGFGAGPLTDSVGQPLKEGDRIVWAHGFCGRCLNCTVEHQPTTCLNRRGYGSGRCTDYPYLTGGFAEYCYVFPTSGRIKVPDELSDQVASASSCALRTVVAGFERLGTLEDYQTVLIQGSGPLGLFAVAKAVTSGVSQVICVGGPKARLELASKWGATHTVDVSEVPDAGERRDIVMGLTGGRGADVVIEVSGVVPAFNEGMDLLRTGGRYLIVGQAHPEKVDFNPSQIMFKQATLIGSMGASIEHYWKALEFLRVNRHRFDWDDMISNQYPLEQINDALEKMSQWQEVKPAITFA
jgi:L-iditol 2-dehydrogenase